MQAEAAISGDDDIAIVERIGQFRQSHVTARCGSGKPPAVGVTDATTAGHILAKRASISGHESGPSKRDHSGGDAPCEDKGFGSQLGR